MSRYIAEQINRLMLFLVGVTGLIGAAVLNGIPSITCYSLADAYKISLSLLGVLFVFEFVAVLALAIGNGWRKHQHLYKGTKVSLKMVRLGVGLGDLVALLCILSSVTLIYILVDVSSMNIQLALDHCLEDGPQREHNLHDRIPLFRAPFTHPYTRF